MGNNDEIRKRMESYRSILLVINWIGAIALIIVGFVMVDSIGGLAAAIIVGAIILGIVGHFLINVALAIPFILLNNGDILESIKINNSSPVNSNVLSSDDWVCNKCNHTNRKTALFCNSCGEKK